MLLWWELWSLVSFFYTSFHFFSKELKRFYLTGNLTTLTTLAIGTTVFSFSVVDLCGNSVSSTFTLTVANKVKLIFKMNREWFLHLLLCLVFIFGCFYQPPVFQNLPNTTEISEDLSEETELFILTVTDPTVGDVVTCSLNSTVPTTNDVYFYYSVGRSSKNSISLLDFTTMIALYTVCFFLKFCMKKMLF